MLRYVLVFLVILLTIGVNAPESMLGRAGLDPNALLITLTALVLTGLIAYRGLAAIIATLALVVGANMPASLAAQYGINRDYLLASLIAVVCIPIIKKIFG
jgi:hypothetical protein